jgi:alpha-D-xyloside xylohydrolase
VYAGKNGSFYLYEDEGVNYNYERGACSKIPFNYNDTDKTLTIGDRNGSYPGMLESRTFKIHYIRPTASAGWDNKKQPDATLTYTGKAGIVKLQ